MRTAAALLLMLAACACATTTAMEPGRLTREEVRSLPDEALARRVFGSLAPDMFTGLRTHGRSILGGPEIVWFWTRPRRDWLRDGLCVSDRIIVHFEPAWGTVPVGNETLTLEALTRRREAQPLRLFGMVLQTYYIVHNRDLATRLSGFDPRELEGQAEACAGIDPRRAESTPADNGFQLMKAFELVQALGDGARAGRAIAPLDCTAMNWNGPPPADEAACLQALAHLREHSVDWVQGCAEEVVFETSCIRVMTSDWFIYFLYGANQVVTRVIIRGMEDMSQVG